MTAQAPSSDLYGLPISDLPLAWRAVRAVAVVECMTEHGTSLRLVCSGANRWTALGMLETARIRLADSVGSAFSDD